MKTLALFLVFLINAFYIFSGTVLKVTGIGSGSYLNIT